MARTISIANLITLIRSRGDIRSVRHTDATLKTWIDESYCELYDLLVDNGGKYFMTSTTVSVVSGTGEYSLPADFYKIVGLDMPFSGQTHAMDRFKWSERHRLQTGGSSQRSTRYCVIGANLYLRPVPAYSATLTLWYTPAPATPAVTGTAIDGHSGWERFIVEDVCRMAAEADDEDASKFERAKALVTQRIISMATERDKAQPDSIRDVEGEGVADWPNYLNP